MLRMLILADDLSGAADCGVAFTRAGLHTTVALDDVKGDVHSEVLSIDADTRGLSANTLSIGICFSSRRSTQLCAAMLLRNSQPCSMLIVASTRLSTVPSLCWRPRFRPSDERP
jgi:hypothetical protein